MDDQPIPAAEFDFSTINRGDEVTIRLRIVSVASPASKGVSKDDFYCVTQTRDAKTLWIGQAEIHSVIPAPKPRTLRQRAIEAANKAWNDASFSDRTIERLALAVLAEVEKGQ